MLTNNDWARIRAYTDRVIGGEMNDVIFHGGRVTREPDGGVIIRLYAMQVNLEPESRITVITDE